MKTYIQKPLLFIAIGAIFTTVSELWFYQTPPENNLFETLFAYGLIGYLSLIILNQYSVKTFAGFFIAAGMFGFMIEGIPVPVLYSLIPFSVVWTSLAWHALITVTICWYWFRIIMAKKSWLHMSTYNIAIGLGLGVWGGYFWNVVESDTGEVAGWLFVSPTIFATQFMFGWLLFTLGHLTFDWVTKQGIEFSRRELWGVGTLTACFYALLQLIPAFPVALLLPILICISVLALHREKIDSSQPPVLTILSTTHIPYWRYVFTLLIPVSAITIYTLIYALEFKFEANVLLILTAGPLALWWWLRSFWQLFNR